MTSRQSKAGKSNQKRFSQRGLIYLLGQPVTLTTRPYNTQYKGIVHRITDDGVFLRKTNPLRKSSFIPFSKIRFYSRVPVFRIDGNAAKPTSARRPFSKGAVLAKFFYLEHTSDDDGDASDSDHPVPSPDTRPGGPAPPQFKNHNTKTHLEAGREARWLKEKNRLLARNEERGRQVMILQAELVMLRDKLATQDHERREERALDMERLKKAQAESRILREKLNALKRERREEKERMTGLLHQVLSLHFVTPSMMDALPKYLQGKNAQMVVDYLSDMLNLNEILKKGERKRAFHLLCKIAKWAQVYPKAVELIGVECDFSESINEGGFGVIYKGMFRGRPVCIKAVRMYQVGAKERALRAHAGELVLGTHVLHPNVIPFYGAFMSSEKTPRICITTPWLERGNLVNHLHQYPDTSRILLVSDILSGLGHLHEMAIVHADLKGHNVLISHAQRAVLADFGVSRIAMTNAGTTTSADSLGTPHWMAPELLTGEVPSPATLESDMWAFGCVCYEILSGKIPFREYRPVQLMRAFDLGNITPSRPNLKISIPYADEIWSLAENCFDYDPGKRPTANASLKIVLDLNVTDNRPPIKDPKWFFKRPRSAAEPDFAALVSIIQLVNQVI